MKRIHLYAIAFSLSLLAAIISAVTYAERKALPYNEMGRYLDENYGIIYEEQALIFYGIFLALFTLLTFFTASRILKLHKENNKKLPNYP
ncbi:MAG: hypothetical protein V4519_00145 [Patescibacteria group bacterium]